MHLNILPVMLGKVTIAGSDILYNFVVRYLGLSSEFHVNRLNSNNDLEYQKYFGSQNNDLEYRKYFGLLFIIVDTIFSDTF